MTDQAVARASPDDATRVELFGARRERDAQLTALIAGRRAEILTAVRAGFPKPPLDPRTNARIEDLAGDLLAAEVRALHMGLLRRGRPESEVGRP